MKTVILPEIEAVAAAVEMDSHASLYFPTADVAATTTGAGITIMTAAAAAERREAEEITELHGPPIDAAIPLQQETHATAVVAVRTTAAAGVTATATVIAAADADNDEG